MKVIVRSSNEHCKLRNSERDALWLSLDFTVHLICKVVFIFLQAQNNNNNNNKLFIKVPNVRRNRKFKRWQLNWRKTKDHLEFPGTYVSSGLKGIFFCGGSPISSVTVIVSSLESLRLLRESPKAFTISTTLMRDSSMPRSEARFSIKFFSKKSLKCTGLLPRK